MSAAKLHVPFHDLDFILNNLINCLTSNGILYVSFKYGNGERKKDGRFFCDMNEERWDIILQNITSATLIQNWQSQDRRIEKQDIWFNSILKKDYSR